MKNAIRNLRPVIFIFLLFLFFIPNPAPITAQASGIVISSTQETTIPPGPDFAIMRERTELGEKREIKKDNIASPGDTLLLDIRIQNTTPEALTGLRAELSCADPRIGKYIFLEKRVSVIGDLAPGASTTLTNPELPDNSVPLFHEKGINKAFRFSLEKRCPPEPIEWTISFRDASGREWTTSLTIQVEGTAGSGAFAGNFNFYVSTVLIENGSLFEASLGWEYNPRLSGDVKFYRSETSAHGLVPNRLKAALLMNLLLTRKIKAMNLN